MLSAFEIRSLLALVFLYATRMLGLFMLLPVMALYAADYSGSTSLYIGLALGIYGLTQGLLQIPFGLASDRFGRKRMILLGAVLFLAGSVLAALADSIYLIIAGRALQGAGAVSGVIMALLADLTREQNRTKAMAAVGGSIGMAFAVAMVVGPLVASHWGLASVFWLTAVLAGIGILIVLFALPDPVSHAGREVIPLPEMMATALRNGELMRLNLGIFSLHFAQMASWVAVPVLLEQTLGFSRDHHWWLYLLTMGGGFMLMVPFIWYGETRRRMKPVFVGAIALLLVAELILAEASAGIRVAATGLLVFFTAFNLLEASLPSLVSKLSPAGMRGTAMGVYATSQFLGAFCGGVTGGYAAHQFGYAAVFWVSLAVILVWLVAAVSMQPPRYLRSLTLAIRDGEQLDARRFLGIVPGVVDLVVISAQRMAYVRVDDQHFDQSVFEAVLGRPLAT